MGTITTTDGTGKIRVWPNVGCGTALITARAWMSAAEHGHPAGLRITS